MNKLYVDIYTNRKTESNDFIRKSFIGVYENKNLALKKSMQIARYWINGIKMGVRQDCLFQFRYNDTSILNITETV